METLQATADAAQRVDASAAAVAQSRAALNQAKINLDYTYIHSPSRGVISRNVDVGRARSAGATRILRRGPRGMMEVNPNVAVGSWQARPRSDGDVGSTPPSPSTLRRHRCKAPSDSAETHIHVAGDHTPLIGEWIVRVVEVIFAWLSAPRTAHRRGRSRPPALERRRRRLERLHLRPGDQVLLLRVWPRTAAAWRPRPPPFPRQFARRRRGWLGCSRAASNSWGMIRATTCPSVTGELNSAPATSPGRDWLPPAPSTAPRASRWR